MTMTLPDAKLPLFALFALAAVAGCSKEASSSQTRVAPSAASPMAAVGKRFAVANGTATFLIDAPLEKIKGRSTKLRGSLDIDPANLKASKGQIDVDLDDLKTETFQDDEKNKAQTGHSKNWLEIGDDVDAKRREENRWARFTIKSIDEVSVPKVTADMPVTLRATGEMWIHGVTSPKTVAVTVAFVGPADAPTQVRVATMQPMSVSLKEHDVKPRDLAGKFLSGALEKIGQKIDDSVQISLDFTAQ
jgi:polyisoprenoid-binding protein YceI